MIHIDLKCIREPNFLSIFHHFYNGDCFDEIFSLIPTAELCERTIRHFATFTIVTLRRCRTPFLHMCSLPPKR